MPDRKISELPVKAVPNRDDPIPGLNSEDGNANMQTTAGGIADLAGGGSPPATETEAKAGTESALRSWSPVRVWQAIKAAVASVFSPKSTDYGLGYGNSFQTWGAERYRAVSFFAGAVSAANLLRPDTNRPNGVDMSGATNMRIGAQLADPGDEFLITARAFAAPLANAALYFHPDVPYDPANVLKVTVTGAVVSGGSGDAAYYTMPVTVEQTLATGRTGFYNGDAGTLRLTDDEPGQQPVPGTLVQVDNVFLAMLQRLSRWGAAMASGMSQFIEGLKDPGTNTGYTSLRSSFRDLLNTVFARLDASNLTAMFRSDVRGPWEPYTVAADQTRLANNAPTANAGEYAFTADPVLDGGEQTIEWRLSDADYPEILAHWSLHRRIEFPDGVLLITGSPNELGNNTLQANVRLVEGALPAVAATARPTIRGLPQWSDVRDSVRSTGADDGHLVTEKAVADFAGGKADPEDTVPFSASFRDAYDRNFVTSLTGNTTGEAFISADNNAPSGLPSTVTDFLAMDQEDAGGTDQTTELAKVAVGDWFRAKRGDKFIIARIAHVSKALTGEFEFWFDTRTEIDETLQYDALPNGAGEIRFYRRSEGGGGAEVAVQNDAPSDPEEGDLWWDGDETAGVPEAKTPDGKYRSLTGVPADAQGSFVTGLVLNIAPDAASAVVRVRGHLTGSCQPQSSVRHVVPVMRRKIGTGSWTGIHGSGQFTVIGNWQRMTTNDYRDWGIVSEVFDIPIRANTTSNVRIAVGLMVIDNQNIVSNVNCRFNRPGAAATNWAANMERLSWLEVTQPKVGGSISTSTTTTRDADDATH